MFLILLPLQQVGLVGLQELQPQLPLLVRSELNDVNNNLTYDANHFNYQTIEPRVEQQLQVDEISSEVGMMRDIPATLQPNTSNDEVLKVGESNIFKKQDGKGTNQSLLVGPQEHQPQPLVVRSAFFEDGDDLDFEVNNFNDQIMEQLRSHQNRNSLQEQAVQQTSGHRRRLLHSIQVTGQHYQNNISNQVRFDLQTNFDSQFDFKNQMMLEEDYQTSYSSNKRKRRENPISSMSSDSPEFDDYNTFGCEDDFNENYSGVCYLPPNPPVVSYDSLHQVSGLLDSVNDGLQVPINCNNDNLGTQNSSNHLPSQISNSSNMMNHFFVPNTNMFDNHRNSVVFGINLKGDCDDTIKLNRKKNANANNNDAVHNTGSNVLNESSKTDEMQQKVSPKITKSQTPLTSNSHINSEQFFSQGVRNDSEPFTQLHQVQQEEEHGKYRKQQQEKQQQQQQQQNHEENCRTLLKHTLSTSITCETQDFYSGYDELEKNIDTTTLNTGRSSFVLSKHEQQLEQPPQQPGLSLTDDDGGGGDDDNDDVFNECFHYHHLLHNQAREGRLGDNSASGNNLVSIETTRLSKDFLNTIPASLECDNDLDYSSTHTNTKATTKDETRDNCSENATSFSIDNCTPCTTVITDRTSLPVTVKPNSLAKGVPHHHVQQYMLISSPSSSSPSTSTFTGNETADTDYSSKRESIEVSTSLVEEKSKSTWTSMYKEIVKFREKTGSCFVPQDYIQVPGLVDWVTEQRTQYKLKLENKPTSLTEERIDFLAKIQFEWETSSTNRREEDRWNDMYQELIRYRERTGNCMVPRDYTKSPDLANWVREQRTNYKRRMDNKWNLLTEKRIMALEKVKFEWNSQAESWNKHLKALAKFKMEFGHCNVPVNPSPEYTKLCNWVRDQRRLYNLQKRGKVVKRLTPERIRQLDELGFCWSVTLMVWDQRYQELLRYRSVHGSCLVPKRYPVLGRWVQNQRKEYQNIQKGLHGSITTSRINKLNAIGFIWYLKEQSENTTTANLDIKPMSITEERIWYPNEQSENTTTANLDIKPMSITVERIEEMEEFRFDSKLDSRWNEMYQELTQYHEQTGNCMVPKGFSKIPGLANWVMTQRRQYKLRMKNKMNLLTEKRIMALEKINFEWDAPVAIWNKNMKSLEKFKMEFGHCNVPHSSENTRLYQWVKKQRRSKFLLLTRNKVSILTPERIRQLDEMGFYWGYDKGLAISKAT